MSASFKAASGRVHRSLLSLAAVVILGTLAGCATSTDLQGRPAEVVRAYELGTEHATLQGCRSTLGDARIKAHADSIHVLLTSYPKSIQHELKQAFYQGLADGNQSSTFSRVPCDELPALLPDQLACNYAHAGQVLKKVWQDSSR